MPRAETEQDLIAEREIVTAIIAKFPKRYDGYLHLSEYGYRLDGALTQKHAHGYSVARLFYEAKDRDIDFGQYRDGLMIGVSKLVAAQGLTKATGLRCCFFPRFTSGVIGSVDFAKHRGEGYFRIGGRTDRADFDHDTEPVAMFPWEDINILIDPRQQVA
jgi:hypothetical protein